MQRVSPKEYVALACNFVAKGREGNIVKHRDAPASRFDLLLEGFDTAAIMINDNDSHHQLKVPKSSYKNIDLVLLSLKCRE